MKEENEEELRRCSASCCWLARKRREEKVKWSKIKKFRIQSASYGKYEEEGDKDMRGEKEGTGTKTSRKKRKVERKAAECTTERGGEEE